MLTSHCILADIYSPGEATEEHQTSPVTRASMTLGPRHAVT